MVELDNALSVSALTIDRITYYTPLLFQLLEIKPCLSPWVSANIIGVAQTPGYPSPPQVSSLLLL